MEASSIQAEQNCLWARLGLQAAGGATWRGSQACGGGRCEQRRLRSEEGWGKGQGQGQVGLCSGVSLNSISKDTGDRQSKGTPGGGRSSGGLEVPAERGMVRSCRGIWCAGGRGGGQGTGRVAEPGLQDLEQHLDFGGRQEAPCADLSGPKGRDGELGRARAGKSRRQEALVHLFQV